MSDNESAINRISQRLRLLVGRGKTKLVEDAGPAQLQQVRLGQLETFDSQPRLGEYGFNSNPPAESDCIMVFAGGSRSDGIIIATGNQKYRMRQLAPGEVSISDDRGQSVYLTQAGIVVNGGGLPVKVTNTPEITLDSPHVHSTGDMTVDGNLHVKQSVQVDENIVAKGDIADHGNKTMVAMRNTFNEHDHPVQNVAGGTKTITSNKPGQNQ